MTRLSKANDTIKEPFDTIKKPSILAPTTRKPFI